MDQSLVHTFSWRNSYGPKVLLQFPLHAGIGPWMALPRNFRETTETLFHISCLVRRRANVQQLTCKIDLSSSFYYLFFSFVLLELKPFVLKWKVPGEKL